MYGLRKTTYLDLKYPKYFTANFTEILAHAQTVCTRLSFPPPPPKKKKREPGIEATEFSATSCSTGRVDIEMSVLEVDLQPNLSGDSVLEVDLDLDDGSPDGPQTLTHAEGLRPDTAQSLPCAVASLEGTPSADAEITRSEAEPEIEEYNQENDEETIVEGRTVVNKRKYPYAAMFFIMTAVVGQR